MNFQIAQVHAKPKLIQNQLPLWGRPKKKRHLENKYINSLASSGKCRSLDPFTSDINKLPPWALSPADSSRPGRKRPRQAARPTVGTQALPGSRLAREARLSIIIHWVSSMTRRTRTIACFYGNGPHLLRDETEPGPGTVSWRMKTLGREVPCHHIHRHSTRPISVPLTTL